MIGDRAGARIVATMLAALAYGAAVGHAQSLVGNTAIATDGTVGAALSLSKVGTTVTIPANLGTRSGNNLFHSFSVFNLFNGDTAQFLGPADAVNIANIISRVTGGTPSSIDGTIDSTAMPNANFFFINPAGIIFGPGATLAVGGSFHATTSDYLRFSDGTRFDARNPAHPVFTAADPAAFGFLTSKPGSIDVEGSTLLIDLFGSQPGSTLTLAGGPVALGNGASVGFAFLNGVVNVFSVASPGEITLAGVSTAPTMGRITLDLSSISVAGGPAIVRADSLVLTNGSAITTIPTDTSPATIIDIAVGTLTLDGSSIRNQNFFGTAGNAGAISIHATDVTLRNGGAIEGQNFGTVGLSPGDVEVFATGAISIASGSHISAETTTPSDGGSILLQAPSISISDAQIAADTQSDGNGGAVTIVANRLTIGPGGSISSTSTGTGNAGNVMITAGSTVFLDYGQIQTSTTESDGGSVMIAAGQLVRLVNGTITTSVQGGTGNGGNITIDPPLIILENGSMIAANAFGGNGGNISLTAADLLASQDSSITASSALGISGTVAVNAPDSDTREGLAVLPSSFLDANAQLRATCSARHAAGPVSSLVGVGRGGLPSAPEGPLLAPYASGTRAGAALLTSPGAAAPTSGVHLAGLDQLPPMNPELLCDR